MILSDGERCSFEDQAARTLYWDGIIELPWRLPNVGEFRDYLITKQLYRGHVKAQGHDTPVDFFGKSDCETASYDMKSVVTAPHFLKFALQFTDFVERFLGAPPRLYSFNGFWTRGGRHPPDPNIQIWHRDRDDKRFVALFLYGTPVMSEPDGPHLYAVGSQRNNDGQHRTPSERVTTIKGPAGTMFFEDPSGLHCGLKPRIGDRLLCWARWGISEQPQSYGWDRLTPVPASEITGLNVTDKVKRSTSLIIDWEK